ncbi:unnamed protein product [Coffea canephora]|uniref:DH200=94 genomic scaffold, scaffold_400 n=1 Tax=Coffea canephora TaxID=49390 RepID=A0A068VFE8_COFCA|nr:unnamed protein product [Coffea canephora]
MKKKHVRLLILTDLHTTILNFFFWVGYTTILICRNSLLYSHHSLPPFGATSSYTSSAPFSPYSLPSLYYFLGGFWRGSWCLFMSRWCKRSLVCVRNRSRRNPRIAGDSRSSTTALMPEIQLLDGSYPRL